MGAQKSINFISSLYHSISQQVSEVERFKVAALPALFSALSRLKLGNIFVAWS
jgi:hypothetical protein